ncbi:MAG TPA: hypothetical protein VHF92_18645 [Geodermatophilus sp.]|nr:hypothetical protein [Geodermatophilus sp.]
MLCCPALGIDEPATDIDGTGIGRAAQQLFQLWPWTPPVAAGRPRPSRWDVPDDRWFQPPRLLAELDSAIEKLA